MKITKLKIENFKAIKNIQIDNLGDTVLIAGSNGCGKSCIFHAIRLLKSIIGGTQLNEWHLWFNEFQMDPNHFNRDIVKLFQTKDRSLLIKIEFVLDHIEKKFLQNEGQSMLEHQNLKKLIPSFSSPHYMDRPLGILYQKYLLQAKQIAQTDFEFLKKELLQDSFTASFKSDGKNHDIRSSQALQLAFSYHENELGVIDYNSSNRNYQRETLQSINLNIQTGNHSAKSNSLYNTSGKYANIKQQMGSDYINNLIKKECGDIAQKHNSDLVETLKELFKEFFPEKKFLGPRPNDNGGIDFPVELNNGTKHDMNDLSSGEKEVLYGYLKLRYASPRNSIILLDEPEVHLNPKLITGLPKFYKNYLGKKLENQIFLITHSDTFLREAMKEKGYQVFHIKPPLSITSYKENQIQIVDASTRLNETLIDLSGDLATYSPDKKVVLLEGKNSEFDEKMISKLFPELLNHVNLLSVGSKHQVNKLHELLEEASQKGQLNTRFFSITDKDSNNDEDGKPSKKFIWDVYHIENYLLDEYFLAKAVGGLVLEQSDLSEESALKILVECAKESLDGLIKHMLTSQVYRDTFSKVDLGFDENDASISRKLYNALRRNIEKISNVPNDEYLNYLKLVEKERREEFDQSFQDNTWKSKVAGRTVLKKFVEKINKKHPQESFSYITLRNNVVSLMAAEEYKPEGMHKIIKEIIDIG